MENVWKKLSEQTPIATESGSWDGLKSEALLLATKSGTIHVGVMYEGAMDGGEFRDFYDSFSDFEIKDVEYWSYVPPLF